MSSSGGVREDAARAVGVGRETIGVTLRTLQKKLQVAFVFFVVGLLGGVLAMRLVIWPQLRADLLATEARIITQTPFDVILMQVKIGLVAGVLATVPPLLYHAREPLKERGIVPDLEVKLWHLAVLGVAAVLLFALGVAYAYGLFFPIVFYFLADYAVKAGLAPMYSIVMWTEFILMLAVSFGLAAQLPLVMSALAYAEIVPYETFRDKWKYAVVGIFTFGAVFSPPDPFTQILWALPLCFLYGVSLYVTKIVVTAKRGSERIDVLGVLRARWNVPLAVAVVGFALGYGAYRYGVVERVNETLVGTAYPQAYLLPQYDPLPVGLAVGALALVGALAYVAFVAIERAASAEAAVYGGRAREPENLNLDVLDAAGVRAAPEERFVAMDEEDALAAARTAIDDGDDEKAQAILDRFDDAADEREEQAAEADAAEEEAGTVTKRTAGMLDAFTEDETTEDDVGGYYEDILAVLGALRGRAFRIAAVFMSVLVAAFGFLYYGGLATLRDDFIGRLPADLRTASNASAGPAADPGSAAAGMQWPITLHPVEALVFEAKVSAVAAAIATLPLVVYYAWPVLAERGILTGDRRTITVWAGGVFGGLAVGSVLGYLFVAPNVITYLVADALRADMVISYRISNFLWMVFLTTAGIGLLMDVPISMALFHAGGLVSYHTMRERWRVAVLVSFALGALLTPDTVYTMLIVGVPLSAAYFLGLGVLWVGTLGGRRGGGRALPERTA
ncbi:Sec-independent protein translocase TatC [Salarchaeum sp. JOR-1]|uniref:Sec-independent protein translocase TatC n=1 Tax=Salarchaeum sp. JOR-1 TaxID=2599399 RepID=UPI001198A043|nr:Sec-independent protein translocase TatC [Salarchaeum sp. JOR-1]QDX40132.1 Sec-independent protein translocase TatC [Salarchaeum sp. JOR-1]